MKDHQKSNQTRNKEELKAIAAKLRILKIKAHQTGNIANHQVIRKRNK